MAQYILTRVLPCTNTKPTRIMAETSYGKTRRMVSVSSYEGHEQAHLGAAEQLAVSLGWAGKWVEGTGPKGNVYVLCPAMLEGHGFIVGPEHIGWRRDIGDTK